MNYDKNIQFHFSLMKVTMYLLLPTFMCITRHDCPMTHLYRLPIYLPPMSILCKEDIVGIFNHP